MLKKTISVLLATALLFSGLLSACQSKQVAVNSNDHYRNYYEIFVYSFADSNGDGIGDFNGLTKRLDYINDGNPKTQTDLGFNGIWLMPISPSPTYHKYDVTDYMAIDPQYGTMDEFKAFLKEADKRGIKVITDLVLNHSSSQHPWFQQACEALANGDFTNKYINYYHFSLKKNSDKYYPVPGADGWYYEAVFWDQMPDFALDNAALREDIKEIMKFWLDLGVFGFRFDAVTQFYTGDDSKNIEFLSWLAETGKNINPDAYFVAEAWTDEATYSKYYQSGIDSFFDFSAADSLGLIATAVNASDGRALSRHFSELSTTIVQHNPHGINAPFLSNHDMGRAAGYFAADLGKMKLAAVTYLLSPGASFTYYGEEIGMRGSGRDENKRAPMLWTSDLGTIQTEITKGPIEMESNKIGYPFGSVAEQAEDPASLLNFYKKVLQVKNTYPIIARGSTTTLQLSDDNAIAALVKGASTEDELLLIYNFSEEPRKLTFESTFPKAKLALTLAHENETEFADGRWILPAYSVTIFTIK